MKNDEIRLIELVPYEINNSTQSYHRGTQRITQGTIKYKKKLNGSELVLDSDKIQKAWQNSNGIAVILEETESAINVSVYRVGD